MILFKNLIHNLLTGEKTSEFALLTQICADDGEQIVSANFEQNIEERYNEDAEMEEIEEADEEMIINGQLQVPFEAFN